VRTGSGARGPASRSRAGGPFLLVAAAGLAASALILVAFGESEWPMFVFALGGLAVGRVAGVAERPLAVVALTVIVFALPIALFTSPIPRATSTIAHLAVAASLAWVLASPARRRWDWAKAPPWSPRWFVVPALVLAIGAVWELGEWAADGVFETDLTLRPFDTLADLVADFVGAVVGLALHDRASVRADPRTSPIEGDQAEAVVGADA
jgi:hypothetical protein